MKATAKIHRIRHKRKSLDLNRAWLIAYNKELKKPQWLCDDAECGQQMHENHARQSAEIAVMFSKGNK